MKFRLKSIRQKLILGFSLTMILVVMLSIVNFNSVKRVNSETESIINEQIQLLILNNQIASSLSNGLRVANSYVLSGNSRYKEQFEEYQQLGEHYANEMAELLGSNFDSTSINQAADWRQKMIDNVFQEYDKGNTNGALNNLASLTKDGEESINDFSHWVQVGEEEIQSIGEDLIENGESTLLVTLIITIAVILGSIVIAFVTSQKISTPIHSVVKRMQLLADGDLSQEPLIVHTKDEISQLVTASNDMQNNMRDLLGRISNLSNSVSNQSIGLLQSSDEVKKGSNQMAFTMQQISESSEGQASYAANLSSMMTTFDQRVREVNSYGEQIQSNSQEVLEKTIEGSHLMESSTHQMQRIDKIVQEAVHKVEGLDVHSQQISELVLVIKDIADQTNLLALNAAIEAARAGEQGKGFAVVAEEVRKLAEQSSHSVTNITDIVDCIQAESSFVVSSLQEGYEEVGQGTAQIKATSETFQEISDAVKGMATSIHSVSNNISEMVQSSEHMNRFVEEIAANTEEAAAGIEETSAASQQISSSMEEMAASSNDLAQLVKELHLLVDRFKL